MSALCEHVRGYTLDADSRLVAIRIAEPWRVRAYPLLAAAFHKQPSRCCALEARAQRWSDKFGPRFNARRHGKPTARA